MIELIVGGATCLVGLAVLASTVKIVPHMHVYNIERLGKFSRSLTSGLNILIPFVDSVNSDVTLQEEALNTKPQEVITGDSIMILVDGLMYIRVLDPYKAAYNVTNYHYAIEELAQSTMRSQIGKMTLDKVSEERTKINDAVIEQVNAAAEAWGVALMRYEIKTVTPPEMTLRAMEKRVTAEREKIAAITKSEGEKQAVINNAEAHKQSRILEAEANKRTQILNAQGKAESIDIIANAESKALALLGLQAETTGGKAAMTYNLAQGAVNAKIALAKEGTVLITTEGNTSTSNIVAEAIAISSVIGK